MTDAIIMAACVAAGAFVLWFVQGLLTSIGSAVVGALPIG